jgi:hypothetical protein
VVKYVYLEELARELSAEEYQRKRPYQTFKRPRIHGAALVPGDHESGGVLVLEFAEGRTRDQLSPEDRDRATRAFARAVAEFHIRNLRLGSTYDAVGSDWWQKVADLTRRLHEDVARDGRLDLLNDRLVARLAELAETATSAPVAPGELNSALHGDLTPGQLLYHVDPVTGEETVWILDWETSVDSLNSHRLPLPTARVSFDLRELAGEEDLSTEADAELFRQEYERAIRGLPLDGVMRSRAVLQAVERLDAAYRELARAGAYSARLERRAADTALTLRVLLGMDAADRQPAGFDLGLDGGPAPDGVDLTGPGRPVQRSIGRGLPGHGPLAHITGGHEPATPGVRDWRARGAGLLSAAASPDRTAAVTARLSAVEDVHLTDPATADAELLGALTRIAAHELGVPARDVLVDASGGATYRVRVDGVERATLVVHETAEDLARWLADVRRHQAVDVSGFRVPEVYGGGLLREPHRTRAVSLEAPRRGRPLAEWATASQEELRNLTAALADGLASWRKAVLASGASEGRFAAETLRAAASVLERVEGQADLVDLLDLLAGWAQAAPTPDTGLLPDGRSLHVDLVGGEFQFTVAGFTQATEDIEDVLLPLFSQLLERGTAASTFELIEIFQERQRLALTAPRLGTPLRSAEVLMTALDLVAAATGAASRSGQAVDVLAGELRRMVLEDMDLAPRQGEPPLHRVRAAFGWRPLPPSLARLEEAIASGDARATSQGWHDLRTDLEALADAGLGVTAEGEPMLWLRGLGPHTADTALWLDAAERELAAATAERAPREDIADLRYAVSQARELHADALAARERELAAAERARAAEADANRARAAAALSEPPAERTAWLGDEPQDNDVARYLWHAVASLDVTWARTESAAAVRAGREPNNPVWTQAREHAVAMRDRARLLGARVRELAELPLVSDTDIAGAATELRALSEEIRRYNTDVWALLSPEETVEAGGVPVLGPAHLLADAFLDLLPDRPVRTFATPGVDLPHRVELADGGAWRPEESNDRLLRNPHGPLLFDPLGINAGSVLRLHSEGDTLTPAARLLVVAKRAELLETWGVTGEELARQTLGHAHFARTEPVATRVRSAPSLAEALGAGLYTAIELGRDRVPAEQVPEDVRHMLSVLEARYGDRLVVTGSSPAVWVHVAALAQVPAWMHERLAEQLAATGGRIFVGAGSVGHVGAMGEESFAALHAAYEDAVADAGRFEHRAAPGVVEVPLHRITVGSSELADLGKTGGPLWNHVTQSVTRMSDFVATLIGHELAHEVDEGRSRGRRWLRVHDLITRHPRNGLTAEQREDPVESFAAVIGPAAASGSPEGLTEGLADLLALDVPTYPPVITVDTDEVIVQVTGGAAEGLALVIQREMWTDDTEDAYRPQIFTVDEEGGEYLVGSAEVADREPPAFTTVSEDGRTIELAYSGEERAGAQVVINDSTITIRTVDGTVVVVDRNWRVRAYHDGEQFAEIPGDVTVVPVNPPAGLFGMKPPTMDLTPEGAVITAPGGLATAEVSFRGSWVTFTAPANVATAEDGSQYTSADLETEVYRYLEEDVRRSPVDRDSSRHWRAEAARAESPLRNLPDWLAGRPEFARVAELNRMWAEVTGTLAEQTADVGRLAAAILLVRELATEMNELLAVWEREAAMRPVEDRFAAGLAVERARRESQWARQATLGGPLSPRFLDRVQHGGDPVAQALLVAALVTYGEPGRDLAYWLEVAAELETTAAFGPDGVPVGVLARHFARRGPEYRPMSDWVRTRMAGQHLAAYRVLDEAESRAQKIVAVRVLRQELASLDDSLPSLPVADDDLTPPAARFLLSDPDADGRHRESVARLEARGLPGTSFTVTMPFSAEAESRVPDPAELAEWMRTVDDVTFVADVSDGRVGFAIARFLGARWRFELRVDPDATEPRVEVPNLRLVVKPGGESVNANGVRLITGRWEQDRNVVVTLDAVPADPRLRAEFLDFFLRDVVVRTSGILTRTVSATRDAALEWRQPVDLPVAGNLVPSDRRPSPAVPSDDAGADTRPDAAPDAAPPAPAQPRSGVLDHVHAVVAGLPTIAEATDSDQARALTWVVEKFARLTDELAAHAAWFLDDAAPDGTNLVNTVSDLIDAAATITSGAGRAPEALLSPEFLEEFTPEADDVVAFFVYRHFHEDASFEDFQRVAGAGRTLWELIGDDAFLEASLRHIEHRGISVGVLVGQAYGATPPGAATPSPDAPSPDVPAHTPTALRALMERWWQALPERDQQWIRAFDANYQEIGQYQAYRAWWGPGEPPVPHPRATNPRVEGSTAIADAPFDAIIENLHRIWRESYPVDGPLLVEHARQLWWVPWLPPTVVERHQQLPAFVRGTLGSGMTTVNPLVTYAAAGSDQAQQYLAGVGNPLCSEARIGDLAGNLRLDDGGRLN